MDYKKLTEKCIKCKACTRNCDFLTKYKIDIGDTERLYELAFHCFLCGRCDEVCPVKIPCRSIILDMRRERIRRGEKLKGYGLLLGEKSNYIFKNYRYSKKKSVLFPGCNFPSFFPKTTQHLIGLLSSFDIGVIYDCCGKPISELGLEDRENKILDRINAKLQEEGIEEVITLCPNCYYYFKGRLKAKLTFIYDKLKELGLGQSLVGKETMRIFPPCPDRKNLTLLHNLEHFIGSNYEVIKDVQCCGLGGVAIVKERELARAMSAKLKGDVEGQALYNYCATCCGNAVRNGVEDSRHFLVEILGTEEKPDIKHSLMNRAKTKLL